MISQALAYPTPQTALSLWAVAAAAPPPSAEVVAAVVMFGDLLEHREDGTTCIRFSRARLEREDVALTLGPDRDRALGVSVIWADGEEQIVRVIDAGPLEPAPERDRGGARPANRYARARMRGAVRPRYMMDDGAAAA